MWERCAVFTAASTAPNAAEHVLCVPLVAVENILGVIYLTSPAASPPFGEDHAYFLSSVSRIAAVTLENLLKLDSLRAENQRLRADVGTDALIGESRSMSPGHRVHRAGGERRFDGADSRRERNRQRAGGSRDSCQQPASRAVHSSPSTALRFPKPCWKANCSGMKREHSPAQLPLKKGKLEVAEDGTLFLDEIGELAPLLQAKLLRVLQQREFERLGGTRLLPFNARVVAATNKNLEQAIKSGEFRQDLYYRLNVVSVALPPLREHREDIPLLAMYFAKKFAAKCKRGFKGISRGSAIAADAIQLAGQRARAGERHRTRDRAGADGRDPAGGPARGDAGRAVVRRGGGAVSQHAQPDEEAAGDHGDGRREREPRRGCTPVGNSPQVSAPAH